MLLKKGYGLIYYFYLRIVLILVFISCFPHIVNLACKATIAAITTMSYAEDQANDYEPSMFSKDTIATVRSLVNAVKLLGDLQLTINDNLSRSAEVT